MPITQDRLTKLRNFGLSEYAARAYLALLDLGTAEARDVSSISKVPQAKIYHVLEQLHEKGLVVILPEFPKKYVPVPFEDYLTRLFQEHTKAAESIEAEREALAEMFAVVGDTDVGNRGFFTVIRGRRNVLSKIEEMIQDTKRDLLVLGTVGTTGRAQHMAPEFARARARGVRVRMLLPLDAETLPRLTKVAQHADIRARDLDEEASSQKVAIVISDSARAFLIHFVPDDANVYAGKDIGVFTDQEAMVAAIQAIVEPHWASGADMATRRAQIQDGREDEFSRIHTSDDDVRRALERALASGAREVLAVLPRPLASARELEAVAARAAGAGAAMRALVNVPSLPVADAIEALVAKTPGLEVRHLASRTIARQWVLDDREAFVAIADASDDGGSGGDLVIQTNHHAAVASMRGHVDGLWRSAAPLATRRQELELFPRLPPGDLGLGVLFHQIEDAVLVCDREGKILVWNPAAARAFGRGEPRALPARVTDVAVGAHAEALARAVASVDAATAGTAAAREILEGECEGADGATLEVEWSVSALVDPAARERLVLCIARDVTARRRAEADVRERERQLAQAELLARIGSWTWDVPENRVTWSEGLHRIYGTSPDATLDYEFWLSHVHAEDRDAAAGAIAKALEARGAFGFTYRIVRADGDVRTLLARGEVVTDEEGRVARLVGVVQDATGAAGNVPVLDRDAAAPATPSGPSAKR